MYVRVQYEGIRNERKKRKKKEREKKKKREEGSSFASRGAEIA